MPSSKDCRYNSIFRNAPPPSALLSSKASIFYANSFYHSIIYSATL